MAKREEDVVPVPKGMPQPVIKTTRSNKPEIKEEPEEVSVTQGSVDKVIDLAFNPTRDKIREVTIIDRMQGRLLPQLDLVDLMWKYCVEVAIFRQDSENYERLFDKPRPIPPDLISEFMYRTAQWQKSVAGKNLERATDIALAETETRGDDTNYADEAGWKE